MVTVAASAPVHNDSKFVFRTWINNTGWDNNVMCFITGLVNPLYSLGGLDGISVSPKQYGVYRMGLTFESISQRRCRM